MLGRDEDLVIGDWEKGLLLALCASPSPGSHYSCPVQDLQLPAPSFPFSCLSFFSPLSLWHQPWLRSLHPSNTLTPVHHLHSPLCQWGVWSSYEPAHFCTATSRAGSGLRTPWTSGPSAPGFLTSGSERCWRAGAESPPGAGPSPSSAAWSTTHSSGLGTKH